MDQLAIIRALEKDPAALSPAAAAMYRIREPKGSAIRPFEVISENKKKRNAELALQLLTAMFDKYPNPEQVRDRQEVIAFLGEQMYRTLAPRKSESFPYDRRTPFARSYYEGKAERFLYDFLLPLSQRHHASQSSAQLGAAPSRPALKPDAASKRLGPTEPTVILNGSGPENPGANRIGPGATHEGATRPAQVQATLCRPLPIRQEMRRLRLSPRCCWS